MAVGYCSDCRRLVEIRSGERHDGYLGCTTSRRWYPLPHRNADGEWCGSSKEAGDVDFGVKSRHDRGN